MSKDSRDEQLLIFLAGFLTLLGGYLRIAPVLAAGFPVNDGGMFYSMTQDLVSNGFRLPLTASYNGLGMPFAYPPLAFYLAGGLAGFFQIKLIDVFILLPPLISALTIPAFFLLAKDLSESSLQAGMAVLFFTFIPASFDWLVMGGGITRALGVFFSLLAFWAVQRMYRRGAGWKYVLAASLFAALAILSHPEAALQTVTGMGIIFLFFGLNQKGIFYTLLVAVITLLFTSTWWSFVLKQHGLAPFLAAGGTGGYRLDLWLSYFQLSLAGELGLTFAGVLAVLGMFGKLARRDFFLPAWALAIVMVEPRSGTQHLVPVVSILAGYGLDYFVLSKLMNSSIDVHLEGGRDKLVELFSGGISRMLVVYLLIYYIVAGFGVMFEQTHSLVASPDSREAFAWINSNLPGGARWAVISGGQPLSDPVAEWLPALTAQKSVATVQGFEWMPGVNFNEVLQRSYRLQLCVRQDAACVTTWRSSSGLDFDFVLLDKARIQQMQGTASGGDFLQKSMLEGGEYDLIHETESVALLKVVR